MPDAGRHANIQLHRRRAFGHAHPDDGQVRRGIADGPQIISGGGPADVRAFLKALTGETTNHLRGSLAGNGAKRAERMNDADWRLVAISAGLGFLSLLLTLLRNL